MPIIATLAVCACLAGPTPASPTGGFVAPDGPNAEIVLASGKGALRGIFNRAAQKGTLKKTFNRTVRPTIRPQFNNAAKRSIRPNFNNAARKGSLKNAFRRAARGTGTATPVLRPKGPVFRPGGI